MRGLAICIGILLAATWVSAQDGSQPSSGAVSKPGASVMEICDLNHPPPCAAPPRPIEQPEAHYSSKARKKKINGYVSLVVIVAKDGLPHDIQVARGLGYGLDEEAVKAVRKWKFAPATFDGVPVPVRLHVDVSFRIY